MAKTLRGPKRPSLTIPQAAEYTGLSVRQIKRLVGERALPYWKTAASQQGHVMLDPDDLDQYIEDHRVEALEQQAATEALSAVVRDRKKKAAARRNQAKVQR